MSNKQSSVEWLCIQLWEHMNMQGDGAVFNNLLEQAKAMHKEEVTQAHTTGYIIGGGNGELYEPEQYYNETFGGNK